MLIAIPDVLDPAGAARVRTIVDAGERVNDDLRSDLSAALFRADTDGGKPMVEGQPRPRPAVAAPGQGDAATVQPTAVCRDPLRRGAGA